MTIEEAREYVEETDEQRFMRMRAWIVGNLK